MRPICQWPGGHIETCFLCIEYAILPSLSRYKSILRCIIDFGIFPDMTSLFGLSKERPYLVLDPNLIWTCFSVIHCKLVVYNCKLVVYNCKVLNFSFTTVILITLLDTVEVTPFFQFFLCKAVVYSCKTVANTPKVCWNKMATYPFSSSMTILTCQKNYISTQFKLLNYIYHVNCIKIFTWLNYTFHSVYSYTSPSTKQNLPNHLF